MIDNGSTDDTLRILQDHPRFSDMTLFQWDRPFHQIGHTRRAVRDARIRERFQWLIVADGDEYWFATSGQPLAEVLAEYHQIDLIYCNWTNFGTAPGGKDPASLRKELVRCQPELGPHAFTKWAVRTSAVKRLSMLGIHKVSRADSSRTVSDTRRLQINHYFSQSRSYWRDVKMQRGSAVDPATSKLRTWEMFDVLEAGCTAVDERLARLVREADASQLAPDGEEQTAP